MIERPTDAIEADLGLGAPGSRWRIPTPAATVDLDALEPHCDRTIDRYDVLHLVRGDVLVDMVRVEARGASA